MLDRQLATGRANGETGTGGATRRGTFDRRPWQRLSPEVERGLVLAAAAGDPVAREHLVEAFLPLIGSVARGYRSTVGVDRSELMQEGVVGLLRALERYDATRGTPFWAYASWWVRQAMQQVVAEVRRPMVLSDRALRQLARVKDARRVHLQAHGREPTNAELSDATELPLEQVQRLLAVDRTPRAFEEPLAGDDGAGTLGDLVADPSGEDAYDSVVGKVASEQVSTLPDALSERERAILSARYGLGCEPQTLREIADGLGLSAERVRQIEERALWKLREAAAFPTVPGADGEPGS
jgi:RNA polymerase sigma factor (sigma-70 family)